MCQDHSATAISYELQFIQCVSISKEKKRIRDGGRDGQGASIFILPFGDAFGQKIEIRPPLVTDNFSTGKASDRDNLVGICESFCEMKEGVLFYHVGCEDVMVM